MASPAFPITVPAKHADGSVFPVRISMSMLKYPNAPSLFAAMFTFLPRRRMGLVLDRKGTIKAVTTVFTETFGFTDEDIFNMPVSKIIPLLNFVFPASSVRLGAPAGSLRHRFSFARFKSSSSTLVKLPPAVHLVQVEHKGRSLRSNPEKLYVAEVSQSGPRECLVLLEELAEEMVLLTCHCASVEEAISVELIMEQASPSASWALGITSGQDLEDAQIDLLSLFVYPKPAATLSQALYRHQAWNGTHTLRKIDQNPQERGILFKIAVAWMCDDTVSVRLERSSESQGVQDVLPTLQHYKSVRIVGEGTYGNVYEAIHLLTQRRVAIKRVRSKQSRDRKSSLPREVELQSQLMHINVAMLYDIVVMSDFTYIIQEFISGGDLHSQMTEPMSESRAAPYVAQMARGLRYLHSCKVAHRDVKLENLMIGDNGVIKLVDFGLSGRFDNACTMSTTCGTPGYTAPELYEGKPYNGPAADMWSVGVSVFALLTCTYPFMDTQDSVLCRYEWPDGVGSAGARELVNNLLQLNPSLRFTPEKVIGSPWIRKHSGVGEDLSSKSSVVPDFAVKDGVLTLRNDILGRMHSDFGFEPDMVVRSLQLRLLNQVSITYKLLLLQSEAHELQMSNTTRKNLLSHLESHAAADVDRKIELSQEVTKISFRSDYLLAALKPFCPNGGSGSVFALKRNLNIEETSGNALEEALGVNRSSLAGTNFVNLLSVKERKNIGDVDNFISMMSMSGLGFQLEMVHRNGEAFLCSASVMERKLGTDTNFLVIKIVFPIRKRSLFAEGVASDALLSIATGDGASGNPLTEPMSLEERQRVNVELSTQSDDIDEEVPLRLELAPIRSIARSIYDGGWRAISSKSRAELQQSALDLDLLVSALIEVCNTNQASDGRAMMRTSFKSDATVQNVVNAAIVDLDIEAIQLKSQGSHVLVTSEPKLVISLLHQVLAAASHFGFLRLEVSMVLDDSVSFVKFQVFDKGNIPLAERDTKRVPWAMCYWQAADNVAKRLDSRLSVETVKEDGTVRWTFMIID